jgi:PQQ-dependent catabolism-associated CXXCW motif protein
MIGRALALCLLLGATAALAQTVPEPAGFHGEPYRAPVPATLAGAQVITPAEAVALHRQGVPFLDVLPRQKRPDKLPAGTIWNAPPHQTIPGAVWLYDTGYDRISAVEQARLRDGLAQASGGDKAAPIVIFCKSDCWMSWNAGKRAVGMGYTGIRWFPQGVDGWQAVGGTLVTADAP